MEDFSINLTLTEILLVIALALVITIFTSILHLFDSKNNKKSKINFAFFTMLIIVIGTMHYKSIKENLIEGFYNNQELLCKESGNKKLILSKAKGFMLKSDYFIGDEHIIYIGECLLLEDVVQKATEVSTAELN